MPIDDMRDYEKTKAAEARTALAEAVGVETLCDRSGTAAALSVRLVMRDGSKESILLSGLDMSMHAGGKTDRIVFWFTDESTVVWHEPKPRDSADGKHPAILWKTDFPAFPGTVYA